MSVSEQSKIALRDGSIFSEVAEGKTIELNKAHRVSMNFWILAPCIFRFLESKFREFIEQHWQDPTAECRLPDIIQNLLQRGEITVECLPHDDPWFGLTHSSDYETAASAIQAMHDDGTYPTPLWKDDA